VHRDSPFNSHIRVLLSGIEGFKFCIEAVELHLDLRTSRKLSLCRAHTIIVLYDSLFGIELTRDLVLVALDKLCDHSPDHVEFLSFGRRHRHTKVFKLDLGLLELLTNLVHDFRQTMSDVRKQYASHLGGECLTTEVTRGHG